ncbi:MAG: hypothetical protein HY814_11170 [Candidatus Riflebacteria bacterium]|nr:hypothetical protein [Candidatus Riflebacteria bacterium]
MRSFPLSTRSVLLVFVLTLLAVVATPALARPMADGSPAALLRDEIQCLNLLTALYLSAEQIQKILPILDEATKARQVLDKRGSEMEAMFMAPGNALKATLARGGQVDDLVARPVFRLNDEAKEMMESYRDFSDGLAQKIVAVLDENQKQRAIDYKACLVPTQDLRDPDRIGSSQPTSGQGQERLLDRARKVPEKRFQERKAEMMEKLLDKVKKHYAGLDLKTFQTKVESVLERARKMNDLEYETSRESLVAELKPPDANLRHRDKDSAEGKVAIFFLRPCMPDLLRERYHLLTEHQPKGKPVDLTHVTPVTNCKDGKCALNP